MASHKGRSSYCVPPRSLPMCDMTRIQNPSTLQLTRRGKNGGRKWVGGRTGGRVGWETFKDAFVGGDTLVYVRWNITFDLKSVK